MGTKMDMLEITNEEMFCWELSRGASKTEAFRAIQACEGLEKNYVNQLAFRYANQPHIVAMMDKLDDNSFMEYISMRKDVLRNLNDIAINGSSERAQIDASATLLQHTAKVAKLKVEHVIDDGSANLLSELRSVLLENPPKDSDNNKNPSSNNFQLSQDFSLIEAEVVDKVMFEGEEATMEIWEEQCLGCNPTYPKGTTDRETGSNTGCFRYKGKFISNEKAKELLSESKTIECH